MAKTRRKNEGYLINVVLPKKQRTRLKIDAIQNGVSMGQFARQLLIKTLKEEKLLATEYSGDKY